MRRDPRACGQAGTRWTLARLKAACPWLRLTTHAGLARLLDRLQIVWKRARASVQSPDPAYPAKLQAIAQLRALAHPARLVVVYMDECTYGRQPTLAAAYAAQGHAQACARRSLAADTETRLVATLDAHTGRVVYRQAARISVAVLVAFWQQLRAAYPLAERISVIQDNWPLHIHPDVLVALEPQTTPFLRRLPPSWPTEPSARAVQRWGHLHLPIQLVPLPTYAPWTNPIEKLWRWLRQEHLHLHRLADDLPHLRQVVTTALDGFADGSADLLRYVGLSPCPG